MPPTDPTSPAHSPRATPNFFVVGAPKSGTTSLYHYLGQHPDVYMSPNKEPALVAADLLERKRQLRTVEADPDELRAYLDGPMTEQRTGVVSDWEQYLKLFKNVRHETAVGEVSGNYLASSSAPAAIRDRIPHARIVMMLRDPVDRLFSQYSEALGAQQARGSFLTWVEEQRTLEAAWQPKLGPVWTGYYARHLQRYRDHFPLHQVRVFLYDEYQQSTLSVVRALFEFLKVDGTFDVDLSRRHRETYHPRTVPIHRVAMPLRKLLPRVLPYALVKRWRALAYRRPPKITPTERRNVLTIYREDVLELQHMLKRDLSAWLR